VELFNAWWVQAPFDSESKQPIHRLPILTRHPVGAFVHDQLDAAAPQLFRDTCPRISFPEEEGLSLDYSVLIQFIDKEDELN
jgi:hypothetical protein